jgi:hypothetical protein
MFNPPITGNDELDAYLSQLALEGDNATTGVTINNSTGQIIDIGSGIVIGYLYKYMHVKYADSNTGLNISDSPTNKGYFGLYNTNSSTESLNPADYTWYIATGGFGTTKFLFYVTNGGRQFQFQVNTASPSFQWVQDTGSAIIKVFIFGLLTLHHQQDLLLKQLILGAQAHTLLLQDGQLLSLKIQLRETIYGH